MTIMVNGKVTAGNPSLRTVVDKKSDQEIDGEKTFNDETTINNKLNVTGKATFNEVIDGTAKAAYWS